MKKKIIMALAATVGMGVFVGCGEGIQDRESPELGLVNSTDEFNLENLGPRDRDRTLASLEVENVGPGTMKITNVEWIARPDRLHGFYTGDSSTEGGMCSVDADCGAEAFCITASGSCRDLGFPETPIDVLTQRRHAFNFVILRGDSSLNCPEPHDEVPERVRRNYCGELLIETDANNTGPNVEEGRATIYFVTDGSSGLMALSQDFITFTDVVPGGTYARSFSINNEAPQDLTVERVTYSRNSEWFTISPNLANTLIEGNGSLAFTLEMNVPTDVGPEDLEFGTNLNFESSSTGTSPSMFVDVTAGPGDVALIDVTPRTLSFVESSTQTFEIQNLGGATLVVTGIDISPPNAAEFYTVSYEGAEIELGTGSVPNLPPAGNDGPTVRELVVEFTPPADPDVSTVANLEIRHSDTRAESPIRVQLLGDNAEVALGEIATEATRLVRVIADGGEQSWHLPLVNTGTAELEITGLELDDAASNTDAADYSVQIREADGSLSAVVGHTVAPGDISELVLTYAGEKIFPQSLSVSLSSNHAGLDETMQFAVQGQTGSLSELEAEIVPPFATTALVAQPTIFQLALSGSGETATSVSNAIWTILSRPAGSSVSLPSVGANVTMIPDVAGTYRIAVQVRDDQSRQIQSILEFEATE